MGLSVLFFISSISLQKSAKTLKIADYEVNVFGFCLCLVFVAQVLVKSVCQLCLPSRLTWEWEGVIVSY